MITIVLSFQFLFFVFTFFIFYFSLFMLFERLLLILFAQGKIHFSLKHNLKSNEGLLKEYSLNLDMTDSG